MSGSNAYSPARDVTDKSRHPGTGFVIKRRFMCGCIKLQAGGVFKRGMPWKCADCAKGKP